MVDGGELKVDSLQDPTERYELGECIGRGVYADVFEATDKQAGGAKVAVKVLKVTADSEQDIAEEYRILRDFSGHTNLPDFYGVYRKKAGNKNEDDEIWLVMELCEGGPVTEVVKGLHLQNKRLSEEHIAYILKETIKALVYLHENHVMHRNVKGSNILLTKGGEVKLVDFGLAREVNSTLGKRSTCLGSPCWMAPEVVTSAQKGSEAYDSRVDVWALGITAIELADGKPPFEDMHPTRALFQIVRNPPPGLYRPANWSQDYNDFIAECLEKNPDHRPFIMELVEHPFITSLPENDHHLTLELKHLVGDVSAHGKRSELKAEPAVRTGYLKSAQDADPEQMHVEDLAALEKISEDTILSELYERHKMGHCHTFVGDVLLVLNPNEEQDVYRYKHHAKYQYKSRSQNSPHIFAVADRAYQDMLHHEEPQHIILAGESLSGKTTNMGHLFKHLLFMGKQNNNSAGDKVKKALQVIQAFGNASTPLNPNSTRHIMQLQVTFTTTGKVSGGIFWLYQLEKWRVTTTERQQGNFHYFYYFYDAMEAKGCLGKYMLEGGRGYRYLRCEGGGEGGGSPRDDPEGNVVKFHGIQQDLTDLEVEEHKISTMYNLLAAILLLGEVKFQTSGDGQVELENPEVANKVAQLMEVDEKKFSWALLNYCMVEKGTAVRRRHTQSEACEAREVLARGIYQRLVDWVVNLLNYKLSFSRVLMGDFHYISLLDMFGFECIPKNNLEQLLVNTMNEQMQFHYNQRVFAWEMQEQLEEEIPVQTLQYYDNRPTLDALMKKPEGFLYTLDEASRHCQNQNYIISALRNAPKSAHLRPLNGDEFSVAHYTGSVTYDAKNMAAKNHDFLPPEMIETIRLSHNVIVKKLFTNQFSRCGNLTFTQQDEPLPALTPTTPGSAKKSRWGAALFAENRGKARKYNTESQGQFSQLHGMRTASATFRATSLEVLRGLAVGPGSGGTHFVRCLRTDLSGQPRGFQPELVKQQLKALAVVDTAQARQSGYPHRIPFAEFIRRYQFLAFDFDETVEVTKENSRLLLVRLKMEGWIIGKTKVFLKYYHEEYLSMKYEVQVKKIVKVQTMMRAFLAKRNVATKLQRLRSIQSEERVEEVEVKDKPETVEEEGMTEEEAAILIQKEFRGFQVRKQIRPLMEPHPEKWDDVTRDLMRQFCKKWKAKSIFQVLLFYRAARHQDLVYFSQQVHLYNQSAVNGVLSSNNEAVPLNKVDQGGRSSLKQGKIRPTVVKLPFRLKDISYFDTEHMCKPTTARRAHPIDFDEDECEDWDMPFRRNNVAAPNIVTNLQNVRDQETQTSTTSTQRTADRDNNNDSFSPAPYSRDPNSKGLQQSQPPPWSRDSNSKGLQSAQPPPWSHDSRSKALPPPPPRRPAPVPAVNFTKEVPTKQGSYIEKTDFSRSSNYKSDALKDKNEYNRQGTGINLPALKPVPRDLKNPIVEMEMKGKQNAEEGMNDEPPFNFQAMLRKTNTTRASLRRRRDVDTNSSEREVTSSFHNFNKQTDANANFARKSSHINYGIPTPYNRQDSKRGYRAINLQPWSADDKEIITELVPGLMIKGQVSDL